MELTVNYEVDLVVSIGHGEYPLSPRGTLTLENLWPLEEDSPEVLMAMIDEEFEDLWYKAYPDLRIPDADLSWENIIRIRGSFTDLVLAFEQLLLDLSVKPSGDDDVFDYWPSGVRLASQIAGFLGGGFPAQVERVARDVIALFPDFEGELLDKCWLD